MVLDIDGDKALDIITANGIIFGEDESNSVSVFYNSSIAHGRSISFEQIKTVEFSSGGAVTVTAKSGTRAEMKLSTQGSVAVTGFRATFGRGDLYILLKFVKSISFEQNARMK